MAAESLAGRVLCVEDDADTRNLLHALLTLEGFATTCVASAREAVDLAKANQFDLYLLDNWMPEVSGLQLCAMLREFDTQTPILFCSATPDFDKEARRAGAQGYVRKPIRVQILISEINRLLAH